VHKHEKTKNKTSNVLKKINKDKNKNLLLGTLITEKQMTGMVNGSRIENGWA
jgi:hypothetical protein